MVFTDAELAYIASRRLARLATVRPDGQPQNSPVACWWNPSTSTLDVGGLRMRSTWKFRNVASHDKVAIVLDDVVEPGTWDVRCLEIRGRAEAISEPTDSAVPMGDGAVIRIHPTRIISVNVDPDGPGTRDVG